MGDRTALLHVYAQLWQHAEACIVGNRAGLEALRGALECALSGEDGVAEVLAADGEGYDVVVIREDGEWDGPFWSRAALPYADEEEVRREEERGAVWPWERAAWAVRRWRAREGDEA